MHAIHLVFHVSMLEPSTPNTIPDRVEPPPPPVIIDEELQYEISEVLDSKFDSCQKCKLLYLICWSGYAEPEWLPATKLDNAKEVVSDFHANYPSKPGPLSRL